MASGTRTRSCRRRLQRLEIDESSVSTDRVVEILEKRAGVISIELQKHGSLKPPGDVFTVSVLNRELHVLLRELKRLDVAKDDGSGISTTEIASVVFPAMNHDITTDSTPAFGPACIHR